MNQFRGGGFASIPPVVKNLLIINILMLLATFVFESAFRIDLNKVLGLYYFKSDYFRPFQIITHMFMHGGLTHLFFNMFALWMFGRVLESVWGPKRFFIYYIATGLGAAALHTLVNHIQISIAINNAEFYKEAPSPDALILFLRENYREYYDYVISQSSFINFINAWKLQPSSINMMQESFGYVNGAIQSLMNIPTVGASGAVFGVLLGFGMLFPNTQLMLLFPPIPIKAKYLVIGYGAIELYLGVTQPGSNIAHFAHLGGMIFGFFLIKYWNKKGNNFY